MAKLEQDVLSAPFQGQTQAYRAGAHGQRKKAWRVTLDVSVTLWLFCTHTDRDNRGSKLQSNILLDLDDEANESDLLDYEPSRIVVLI